MHYLPFHLAKHNNTHCWGGCGKTHSYTEQERVSLLHFSEINFTLGKKYKHRSTLKSSKHSSLWPNSRYSFKRNENNYSPKVSMYAIVYCSFIYSSQKLETTQMSFQGIKRLWHNPHPRILLNNMCLTLL